MTEMKREFVRVAVELFDAGAQIWGDKNIKRYREWDKPGAKMFIIPVVDTDYLLSDAGTVLRRFSAITVQAIGETDTGPTLGMIDDMIFRSSALEVMGQFGQDFIEYAKLHAVRSDEKRYRHVWVAIFDVDPETGILHHMGPVDANNVMMKIGS